MQTHPHSALFVRILLAVAGGYAASAGLVAALSAVLPVFGIVRSEGVVLASMLGFVAYLTLLLWAFAERWLWRLAAGMVSLAGFGFGLARLIGVGG